MRKSEAFASKELVSKNWRERLLEIGGAATSPTCGQNIGFALLTFWGCFWFDNKTLD